MISFVLFHNFLGKRNYGEKGFMTPKRDRGVGGRGENGVFFLKKLIFSLDEGHIIWGWMAWGDIF